MRVNVFLKCLLLLLVFNAQTVLAIDYTYSVFSDLTYSDNFDSNIDDASGYSSNNGISFGIDTDQNSYLIFGLSGAYSKSFFSLDGLSDQETKQLALELSYEAVSNNFGLLLRDDFSQTPQNRTSTQQFDNVADVNVITIRPSYFFKLSPIDRIYFEGTHVTSTRKDQSGIQSDGSSFDTISKIKSIRYEKKINATTDISFIFNSTDNDLDSESGTGNIDFIQEDAFFRWIGRGASNQLQLEYGRAEIEDELGREFDTNLLNVIYSRQVNRTHLLDASYRKGFLLRLNDNFIDGSVDVSDESFGAAQELVSTNLNYAISETFISLTFNAFDLEFTGTGGNSEETRKGITVTASYSLARIFSTGIDTNVAFSVRKNKNSFTGLDNSTINTKVDSYEFRYNYASSASLSYYISFDKRNAASDNQNTRLNGGDSKSLSIGFSYSPRSITQN